MLVIDIFRLSTRMFRTNRLRTLLTILGISVGIGTILFLVSFGYGLQLLILNQITTSDALLSLDVSTADATALPLDKAALEKIQSVPFVEKISPVLTARTQMVVNGISSEVNTNFVRSDFFALDGITPSVGELFTDEAAEQGKIVISSNALALFNIDEKKVAEVSDIKLLVYDLTHDSGLEYTELAGPFRLSGVINEESSSYLYLSASTLPPADNYSYSRVKVKVDEEKNLNAVREAIISQGYIVSALSDIIEQANQIFRVVQIVFGLFGIVALIVSAIGMFNTMTIALLERTQEIGIMKALGAANADIWNMFLGESVIIGFFGGLGGVLIGLAAGEAFNYGINLLAGVMGGVKIDLFATPYWFVLFIMIFSTFVGFATGVYPASRAAKINCLDALRYK